MVSFLIATCWVTMSSTTTQQLREIAETMGLKGPEIMNFVREQQNLEREEREKQRLFDAEEKEKERQDKAKEDERLEKTRLFELERARLESQEKEKARQENNNNNDCLTAFDPGQPG